MKKFYRIMVFTVLTYAVCIGSVAVMADTIVLKNGKKIQGTISGESAKTVMVSTEAGDFATYERKDIASITRGGAGGEEPVVSVVATDGTAKNFYINKEYGISFNDPTGWIKEVGNVNTNYLVKYTDPKTRAIIGVTRDDVANRSEIKTSLDFAKEVLAYTVKKYQDAKIIKPAQPIDVNGIAAAAIMYDRPRLEKDSKRTIISTMMVFIMHKRNILTINVVSPADVWEQMDAGLADIMNSLKIGDFHTEKLSKNTSELMDTLNAAGQLLTAGKYEDVINMLESRLPVNLTDGDGSKDFVGAYGIGYNNIGAAYLNLGKVDKAITALNKCKEALPGWSAPYYLLGQAYFKKNMFRESAENFNKGFGIDPATALSVDYHYLIIDNLKLNNRGEADKLFKIAKAKFPNNFKAQSLSEIENSLKKQ